MQDQTRTVRLKPRACEPTSITVIWYRPSEDMPATSGPVLNEHCQKVYAEWAGNWGKWYARKDDGTFYQCVAPEWWCYIPEAPKGSS